MATWENEFTTPGSSAQIWLVLQVDLVSQDIANNTSTLNWYLRMEERVNASPFNNNPTSTASANVNGTVYSSGGLTYNFNLTNETIAIASGTTVVTHTADGSKTITVGAAYDGGNPLGTASFSTTYALPTIPRATQPTVSPTSGNTGATYTIEHDPATSSFYHDLAYSLDGGGSYTDIITNLAGTDVSTDWTPAHTLLPNSTSVTAIIRVITRATSGGTIIGTKTVSLPLTVPSSVKPTISAVSFTDAQTSGPDMPTLMGGAGRFVQRWSKLLPTVTAAGAGGSTVTARTVTQNGQTTPSGTAFGLPVALSGSVPFTAVATDSRSRTSDTFASTVAVTAYNFPNLPVPTVQRTSDAGGTTPSPTGTYLKITPAASVSSLNFSGEKNLLEYQIRTRPIGGSWTTVQAWTSTGVSGVTWTTPKIISPYASNTAYEVEISIRDLFGKNGYDTANTIKVQTVNVSSELVFMDWNRSARLSIFGFHSDIADRLEVKGDVDITGDLDLSGVVTQGGYAVIDTNDAATTSAAGIVELATSAETITGTDATRAVTPDGLADLTSTTSRRGLIELATAAEALTGTDADRAVSPSTLKSTIVDANWERVIPVTIASSGSTATFNSATGLITMPAGCTMVRANGVFVAGYDYLIVTSEQDSFTAYTDQMLLRFTTSGTPNSTAAYYTLGRYIQYDGTAGNWLVNAGQQMSLGIGYTGGGQVRREFTVIGAFESTLNTFIKQLWTVTSGAARETIASGLYNFGVAFDGFQMYSATGSFAGTVQIYRRVRA
jgi:hypothetical protein